VPNARSLRLGARGTVFVSTRKEGSVFALRDGRRYTIAEGLNMPNGIDVREGALYVAEMDRILRFDDIESALDKPPIPQVVRADLPDKTHHGWRYIGFGPDAKLYVAIGAPCNTCVGESFERSGAKLEFASITRMNPDGSGWEVVARGVRNSVGFDFHPRTGELWFTDNGSDWMGDDLPSCELNRLTRPGQHFGYPYCHQGDVLDPEFGKGRRCEDFVPPAARLGAHVAPLGMRFYTGKMFPPRYRGQIFVAKHGSWNRSSKSGYTVDLVRLDERGRVTGSEPFIQGWLTRGLLGQEKVSGRPVDVLVMPDGALLVSDDHANRIYRVSYKP
jgi:glucose/arabinose dehydrogenase